MSAPHVDVSGEGEPVVLVHAAGLDARQWRGRWTAALRGFRAIAPDLWGCGRSPAWPGPWPFRLENDLALVRGLLEQHGPAHLVGHSYGGALCLYAAAERPELVRSIAFYEAPIMGMLGLPPEQVVGPLTDPALEGTEAWYEAFVDWWNGPGAWRALPERSRAAQLRAGREAWGQVQDLLNDPRRPEHYAGIRAPILVMRGTKSPPVVHEAAQAFVDAHPTARMEVFEGLGHLAPILEAEALTARVREHLLYSANRPVRRKRSVARITSGWIRMKVWTAATVSVSSAPSSTVDATDTVMSSSPGSSGL